jgi:hypothetical protein
VTPPTSSRTSSTEAIWAADTTAPRGAGGDPDGGCATPREVSR